MAKVASKTAAKSSSSKAVAYVAANALSLDVGEKAVVAFKGIKDNMNEIADLEEANATSRRQTLRDLTLAFAKAAQNDKTIDLELVYSDTKSDVEKLFQKLRVAIGITVATRGEDGLDTFKLAPWTKDYFPQPGEDAKKDEAVKAKENFRSNFATQMKKAAQAAYSVVTEGIKLTTNKEGNLLISGKAVQQHFKQDEVILDDKRKITVGDKIVELAKKPSFTELGQIGAAKRGVIIGKGKDAKAQKAAQAGAKPMTEADVISACNSLIMTIGKLSDFGDALGTALDNLRDAIDSAIDRNGSEEAA